MKNLTLLFLFLITIYLPTHSFSQAGELDPEFNNGNPAFAGLDIAHHDSIGSSIVWGVGTQSDGKIVTFIDVLEMRMVRFNTDGTRDNSFGTVTSTERVRSLAIQDDDKIVVGTGWTGKLERYNADGTIDDTFISTPLGDTMFFYSLEIQPDGKILAFGRELYLNNNNLLHFDNILVRLNADGSLDTNFGNMGKWTFSMNYSDWGRYVQTREDGVIFCLGNWYGEETYIIQIFPNDSLDIDLILFGNSFYSNNFHLMPNGDILLCGQSSNNGLNNIVNTRLDTYGNFDPTYGNGGSTMDPSFMEAENAFFIMHSSSNSSVIQSDGKIIANGVIHDLYGNNVTNGIGVKRYNVDGSVDTTFGVNGLAKVELADVHFLNPRITLDSSGNIIQVSRIRSADDIYDIIVCRYLTSDDVGTLDFGIKSNSVLVFPNPVSTNCTLKFSLTTEKNLTVFLTDVNGKMVHSFFVHQKYMQGEHLLNLDIPSALSAGNYMISISDGTVPVTVQIIKQ